MDDSSYVAEPKDFKDINYNIKLLIQKFNHEHSDMSKKVSSNSKKINIMQKDIKYIKEKILEFFNMGKGISLMLKIILTVISSVGTLIGIGLVFGN